MKYMHDEPSHQALSIDMMTMTSLLSSLGSDAIVWVNFNNAQCIRKNNLSSACLLTASRGTTEITQKHTQSINHNDNCSVYVYIL